jgi:hypothetical protein
MQQAEYQEEANILRAVKQVLTRVIKDTATQPGLKHPLSEPTINGLRDCLLMISQREQILAERLGISNDMRPHFTDEPTNGGAKVIPINRIARSNSNKSE